MTKKKKIIIIIAIILVAIFVGGYAVLRSSFTLNKIRTVAESIASNQLNREVSIGEISGNIFSRLTIRDLAVAKYDKISEGKLIQIDSIDADYSLNKLILLRLDVNEIKINNPDIWVEMNQEGKLNIPEMPQQPEDEEKKPSRFKIVLEDIKLSSGSLRFDDKRDSASLTIGNINGNIAGDKENNFIGKVTANDGQVNFQKIVKKLSDMNVSFETQGEIIKLSEFNVNIETSRISANGEILNGKVPNVNMSALFDMALGDFKDLAPQIRHLNGNLNAKIDIKGEVSDISGKLDLKSDSLFVNDLNIKALNGEANFSMEEARLSSLSASLGKGDVKVSGSVALSNGKLDKFDGKIDLNDLDLNEIATDFTLTEAPFSGSLSGSLSISGSEPKPNKLIGKGAFNISNITASVPVSNETKRIAVGGVKALINIDQSKVSLDLSRAQTVMRVDGNLNDDASLNIKMNLDGLRLSELADIATGKPSVDGSIKASAETSMKITNPAFLASMGLKDDGQRGKIVKDIADLKGNIKLNIPAISLLLNDGTEGEISYAKVASLDGNFVIDDDNVKTDRFVIELEEGEFRVDASVKISEKPYLKADVNLDSIGIESYAPLFSGNVPVRGGVINGQIGVSGEATDLNGEGEVIIHDLALSTRNFDPIIIPVNIKANVLEIPEMTIPSGNEQIKMSMNLSPEGNYSLKINSTPFDISRLYEDTMATQNGESNHESTEVPTPGGTLQFSLGGEGNINKPSLNGNINLKDLRLNGEVFGDGEFVINVQNDKANIDVYLFDQTMVANLVSSIKKPFPFEAQLLMKDINAEPALRLANAGEKLDIHITGDIKAYGNIESPFDTSVDGILQSIVLDAGQYKWSNKSPIHFDLKDRIFDLDEFEIEGDGAKLTANANARLIGSDNIQRVELNADAIISDLDLAVASDLAELSEPVAGNVGIRVRIAGDLDSPSAVIQIDGSGMRYDQFDVDNISGLIKYRDDLLEIERFIVNAFGGQANITFAMPFDIKTDAGLTPEQLAEKDIRFVADVKSIDLAEFTELSPNVESLKGKVDNINIEANGSINHPKIKASVNLKDTFVKLRDVPVPIENLNGQLMVQNSQKMINNDTYEISNIEYDTSLDFVWNMDEGTFNVNGAIKTPREFVEYVIKPIIEQAKNGSTELDPPAERLISILKTPLSDLTYPELNFDVKMDNTQVSPWIKGMVKDIEIPIDGNVSGNIHIEGVIHNPQGIISINPVNLTLNEQEIRNPEPINISIADRGVDISSFNLVIKPSGNSQIGTIKMSGNVNIDEKTYNFGLAGEHLHPALASFVLNAQPKNFDSADTQEADEPRMNLSLSNGDIGFSINSEGKFDAPSAVISANVSDLTIPVEDKTLPDAQPKEAKIDKILCDLSYNDGMFNIERINVNTYGNSMNVSGKVPVKVSLIPAKVDFPEEEMDVKLVMDNFGLEFLSTFVNNIQEFNGNAQADISLSGMVKDPKLAGNLKMQNAKCTLLAVGRSPSVEDETEEDIAEKSTKTIIDVGNINLDVVMDTESISLDDASFSIGEGRYQADGKLKLGTKFEPQDFEFTFKTDPAFLDPFVELGGKDLASRLSGYIKVKGGLRGDLRNFRGKSIIEMAKTLNGTMDIDPQGINISAAGHKIVNPKRIYAELSKGRLNLPSFKIMDVTAQENDATSIAALGMWEIGGDKSFDLTALIDTGLISDFIARPDMTMQGKFGFKLEARGDEVYLFWPPNSNQKSSSLTFQNAVIDEFRGELTYRKQNIDIEQIWLSMGENKVSISGYVPLDDRQMSLQMDARMNDMGILTLVNKDIIESGGRATIGATVTGNFNKIIKNEEQAQFVGSCILEKLSANLERAYINFEDINADISFDSKAISAVEFNKFHGKINDGEFELVTLYKPGIGINWSREKSYRIGEFRNIGLKIKDCTIYQPQMYSIVFDADPIQLRGNYDAPKLTGNVTLKEGLYNESLQSLIQNMLLSREVGVKAVLDYPIVKNLELDVNLIHGKMRMDNNIIEADAEIATARVTGSLADPIIRASGRITQGKFTHLNREFTITKGEFSNDGPLNPHYNIVAEAEIPYDQATGSNIKAQMEIEGSLTERYPPKLSVIDGGGARQNVPDLTQNQIAALIAFGILPGQSISRAFSSSSQLLVEPARQYFESQAEKMLRLKEFKMQVDPRNPREARLAAAKRLTKDLAVTVDVDFGYGGRQWIGLERDLIKNVSVTGKISQEGDWGFDLNIEQEFK